MSCLRQKYYSNLYGKILHVPELKGILYKKKRKKKKVWKLLHFLSPWRLMTTWPDFMFVFQGPTINI